jgi:hypothetical protein
MPFRIAAALSYTLATTAVMIASLMCLTWVGHYPGALDSESPLAWGDVVRTEVTSVWVPQALRDLARRQAGPPVNRSLEKVQTYLARNGWTDALYALTRWEYDANGHSVEISQVRWLSEAEDHLDELEAVMATAAGRPPRFEDGRFAHTRVQLIPDSLQSVESRAEIIRLMADLVHGGKSSPLGGLDSARRTE